MAKSKQKIMHIRTWCYAVLCLFLPITLPAQKEHKYLDHALPEAWQENDSDFQQTLPVDDQWWKAFNDPVLDSLISVASGENYSVLAAIDRMEQARASLRMERSNFFPSITLNGGWLRQQSSGNTTELPQSITHYYDASLNASWELDIFGSIRQRVKAQRETFQASREEYISVQVSLCAQVASAYINLRELQQELQVVMHNCRTQEEVLNIKIGRAHV